jgi:hypothetical protein
MSKHRDCSRSLFDPSQRECYRIRPVHQAAPPARGSVARSQLRTAGRKGLDQGEVRRVSFGGRLRPLVPRSPQASDGGGRCHKLATRSGLPMERGAIEVWAWPASNHWVSRPSRWPFSSSENVVTHKGVNVDEPALRTAGWLDMAPPMTLEELRRARLEGGLGRSGALWIYEADAAGMFRLVDHRPPRWRYRASQQVVRWWRSLRHQPSHRASR